MSTGRSRVKYKDRSLYRNDERRKLYDSNFPHMGNVYIGAKVLMEGLGVDIVIPPPSSDKTLKLVLPILRNLYVYLKINIGII